MCTNVLRQTRDLFLSVQQITTSNMKLPCGCWGRPVGWWCPSVDDEGAQPCLLFQVHVDCNDGRTTPKRFYATNCYWEEAVLDHSGIISVPTTRLDEIHLE